jgi:hypothetical protein
MIKKITTAIFVLASLFCEAQQIKNLDSAKDNMDAYVKVRASLDPKEDVVFYATGSIYGYEPEKPWKHLLNFEMYNIARVEKIQGDSGWRLITREMLVYEDPKTGEIITNWKNPYTNEEVEVFHVWNDPVNQTFKYKTFTFDYKRMGDNRICFYNDVPLSYPSPLKKADWPKNSRSDVYQGAELFNFFCNEKDIYNKKINNVNADISWSRFSDFLPWMNMAQLPGNLLYQSRGWKVKGGYNALPQKIKDYVEKRNPQYKTAPTTYEKPNMTSWKYYKKVMEDRKKKS